MTNPKRNPFLGKIISVVYALLLCLEICSCNLPSSQQPHESVAGTGETPDSGEGNKGGSGGTGGTSPSSGGSGGSGGGSDEVGLPNLGDTCYLNSTMQILARLYPTIFDGLADELARLGSGLVGKIATKQVITVEETQAFYEEFLLAFPSSFSRGRQEDAHEAFVQLRDRYLENSKSYTEAKQELLESTRMLEKDMEVCKNDEWEILELRPVTRNSLSMSELFADNLSMVEGEVSDFNVQEIRKETLPSTPAMKKYFEEYYDGCRLEEDAKYLRVKGKVKREQAKVYLGKLPLDILPIQFCRAISGRKNLTSVTNSLQLEIGESRIADTSPTKKLKWNLVGFILHTGRDFDSGHYIAYVLKDGQWIEFNDSRVSTISTSDAEKIAQNAYLYFYKPAS